MERPKTHSTVQQEDDFGIILTFSDGTDATYVVEELLELRPHRETIHEPDNTLTQ